MLKEEYNKSRPRTECPNCGKLITKACFSKHYNACINPNSKYNLNRTKVVYTLDHADLCCKFCGKELKSKRALLQHEIRCKENVNRIAYQNLSNYINEHRKGKSADNCTDIAKQRQTIITKYKNGYVSPLRGKLREIQYIYKEHNDAEIQKWLAYVKESQFIIPHYDIISHSEGYSIVSRSQHVGGKSVRYEFEHNYIASILLEGKLDAINTVHHIDSNRSNNDPFNLLIFQTDSEHKRFHNSPHAYITYNTETHLFNCILLK